MFAAMLLETPQEQLGSGALLLDCMLWSVFATVSVLGFLVARGMLRLDWPFNLTLPVLDPSVIGKFAAQNAVMKHCSAMPRSLDTAAVFEQKNGPHPQIERPPPSDEAAETQEASELEPKPATVQQSSRHRGKAGAASAAVEVSTTFVEALGPHQRSAAMQVRAISREAFDEDATQSARGEKVALLLMGEEVVAYASYLMRPQLGSFNINKFAVSSARRRQGLGRCLLRHLIQVARKPPPKTRRFTASAGKSGQPLEVVCLAALPTAISFYTACGFREEPDVKLPDDEEDELIEGQVYMEYRLRRRRGGRI